MESSAQDEGDRSLLTRLLDLSGSGDAALLAGRLLADLGSLPAVFAASSERVAALAGVSAAERLLLVRQVCTALLRRRLEDRPLIGTMVALHDYLRVTMAHRDHEEIRIIYLNMRNRLVADEVASIGTIGQAPLYPREIVRRALELGATGVIVAHNHPSGDTTPSDVDIVATRRLADAGRELDLLVHDHVIVSRSGFRSLRREGLLS